ncbi:MAG TPA: cytochrome c oxidase assembly protein [Thermoanaerobaculia bacterium]|nr:cytochrome c oxidase assembly protein [Thermoanaerobaculia bacterium]
MIFPAALDPLAVFLLGLAAWLYARGLAEVWRRAGGRKGLRGWEAACFGAGWITLAIAMVSPLHPWGEILFSAHMAQHETLILAAAPLLVLGRPLAVFLWALPPAARERVGEWTASRPVAAIWQTITGPLAVFVIHGLALWLWHAPTLYQAALQNDAVHLAQHASFFGSAALFWWALVHGRYGRMGYGVAVFYVFATALHSGVLGALLTFAPRLWYPIYAERAAVWGLSPLEDQQLAGLIMWVPSGALFVALGLGLFAAWLGESERRAAMGETERLRQAWAERGGDGV